MRNLTVEEYERLIRLSRSQLEAATAFYSALVKEREQLKQRLEAEFGGES